MYLYLGNVEFMFEIYIIIVFFIYIGLYQLLYDIDMVDIVLVLVWYW